jgi:riboflavin synthase
MFSGIVQQKSPIIHVERKPGLVSLSIDLGESARNLTRGASIAVAGVCLTVTGSEGSVALFDMMGETLTKTTLGNLKVGDLVNTERSIQVGDEIGGHLVSGHVSGVATISNIETPPNNWIITFVVDAGLSPYLFPKGFVALDGCSLTIVDVGSDWFTVHLIPETLRITTFGNKRVGDLVNVEINSITHAVVTTVARHLERLAHVKK